MANISANGTAYELHGPPTAPVVVLIHGLGLEQTITWRDFISPLSEHHRVLSYDLCGHGKSALPKLTPSLRVLSEQLRELLDELAIEQASLIGFSLGGMINRRFAIDHPHRVSSLVILNSPHERSPEKQKMVEENAARADAGGIEAVINTLLERWLTVEYRARSDSATEAIRETVLANELNNYTQHRLVLANGVLELIRPTPAINVPCLVMTCENDSGSTPEMSYAIASEIAGAQTLIVNELQHLGLIEQPEQFIAPIAAFLQRTLGKA